MKYDRLTISPARRAKGAQRKVNMAKIGDKIKIIYMQGEPQYAGREGVIKCIDAIGQLHGTWGGCAIIPETDEFITINEQPASRI